MLTFLPWHPLSSPTLTAELWVSSFRGRQGQQQGFQSLWPTLFEKLRQVVRTHRHVRRASWEQRLGEKALRSRKSGKGCWDLQLEGALGRPDLQGKSGNAGLSSGERWAPETRSCANLPAPRSMERCGGGRTGLWCKEARLRRGAARGAERAQAASRRHSRQAGQTPHRGQGRCGLQWTWGLWGPLEWVGGSRRQERGGRTEVAGQSSAQQAGSLCPGDPRPSEQPRRGWPAERAPQREPGQSGRGARRANRVPWPFWPELKGCGGSMR